MSKLGLGTVQFGLDYGVSNKGGRTSLEEVQKIIGCAAESGIEVIDTAYLYGCSEEVLGEALPVEHEFKIVTKTSKVQSDIVTVEAVGRIADNFYESLARLRQNAVYGLMVHDADDLLKGGAELLIDKLFELKKLGLVRKIGVSVYTQEQIEKILPLNFIDIIQVPVNVYDQRLIRSGVLQELKKASIEIHARSAFLQGLLLMAPQNLPDYFNSIQEHHAAYFEFINNNNFTPFEAALNFICGVEEIDTVVCGINNLEQLKELVDLNIREISAAAYAEFALCDKSIIDPVNWKVAK